MKVKFFHPLLLAVFAAIFFVSPAHPAEKVIMKVYLNTEDKGEYFIMMSDKEVLFRTKDLLEMGFVKIPVKSTVKIGDEDYTPLNSLVPSVKYEIDEKEPAVRITAAPELLKQNTIDLSYSKPVQLTYPKSNSAFFNYSLSYIADNELKMALFNAFGEAGINVKDYLLFSNFSYSKQRDEKGTFVRLQTNLTKDDLANQRRYVLGDFFALSGELGGAANLGGLSVAKNFSLAPEYIRSSRLELSGMLNTPSDVNIYVNGNLVRSEHLPAGAFDYQNIPFASGAGDSIIEIKDAYGRVERYSRSFYVSSAVLRPGLSEYSYNLGFERKNFGIKSDQYDGLAFTGFHNYGFGRGLSAGISAEGDRHVINTGLNAKYLLWGAGEIDATGAYSYSQGRSGYGGSVIYMYAGKSVSASLSAVAFSRDYSNLSVQPSSDKNKLNGSATLGYNHPDLGAVTVSYSNVTNYINPSSKTYSAFYTRRLFEDISLNVVASRTKSNFVSDLFFVGFTFPIDGDITGGLSYQTQGGLTTEDGFIQNSQPIGTGLYYRLLAEKTKDAEGKLAFDGSATLQYNGTYGTYGFDFNRVGGDNTYAVSVAGGVAIIDKSFYLTRPITDGFALVKVDDIRNTRVSFNDQEVGATNRHGEVLVPNLLSYQENKVSFNEQDIPANYSMEETSKIVTPPFRGGVVVKFDVTKYQGFGGTLYFEEKGVKTPAEYAGMEIKAEGKTIEAVVGKGGAFYLENVHPGKYAARAFTKDKECTFDITLPASNETMVDLGEVSCEIH